MTIYIIGIGGTGAKCIESIIHLSALGLLNNENIKNKNLKVLFVDPDESNGTLKRARNTLSKYNSCHNLYSHLGSNHPWMKVEISSLYDDGIWSPLRNISTNKNLGNLFEYNKLKKSNNALANLFDILYTKDEQESELDVGFRGRPSIGSAVMSQMADELYSTVNPWDILVKNITNDYRKGIKPKVFICGSIFGGTGASGIPTIGRLLNNKLGEDRDKVDIASIFMLPYFEFSVPNNFKDEIFANSEQFLLNTEAALNYYNVQTEIISEFDKISPIFDLVYLLGCQNFSEVKFSLGKDSQINKPHFLELYAGLALRDFIKNENISSGKIAIIGYENQGKLTWNDISYKDPEIKNKIINGTLFAYTWLNHISLELRYSQNMGMKFAQKAIPWVSLFFGNEFGKATKISIVFIKKILHAKIQNRPSINSLEEKNNIKIISDWWKTYLTWIYSINQSDTNSMQLELFHTTSLKKILEKENYYSNDIVSLGNDNLNEILASNFKLISLTLKDLIFGESDCKSIYEDLRSNLNSINKTQNVSNSSGSVGLSEIIYAFLESYSLDKL